MLDIQVAGRTIAYKNMGDLQEKLIAFLDSTHRKRVATEESYKLLRKEEDSIRRLLGGCSLPESPDPLSESVQG